MDGATAQNLIRLVLVDDHGLFRDSLSRFLASEPGLEIVGECSDSAEALKLLRGGAVDIALLDLEPGSARSNEMITMASEAGYTGKFLLLATSDDPRSAALALKLGAGGIFLKSEPLGCLVKAIRLVADGQVWLHPRIVRTLADRLVEQGPPPEDRLSEDRLGGRERDVLHGILDGLTNKRIGDTIGVSESTVKNIVQRLFNKAGVKTRSQLVHATLRCRVDPVGVLSHPITKVSH